MIHELRRWRTHVGVLVLAAVLISLALVRVGGGVTTAALPAATVGMSGSTFEPASVTVSVGDSVEWVNDDSVPHTVTHLIDWHSGIVSPGLSFSYTFDTAGTIEYYCTVHAGMTGTVIVIDGAVPTAEPTNSPTPPPPPPGGEGAVEIFDNGYNPDPVTVLPGTLLVWTNAGVVLHSVTDLGGAFHSFGINAGDQWSMLFETEGTYDYYCTYHEGMVGTLIVSASGAPEPTATPDTSATVAPDPPGSVAVDVGDNFFSPDTLAIDAGTTVDFTWLASSFHTVTSDGLFDTGVQQGGTFSFTFDTAGEYQVRCDLHPPMTMTVTVTGSAPPPPPSSVGVEVGDNFFSPDTLAIDAGTTVDFTWLASSFHTVTSDGLFDTGVQQGGTFSFTFDTAGEYQVRCDLHPPMTMTVTVTGSAPPPDPGATSTPTPAPTATPEPTATAAPPPPGTVGVEVGDNFFGPDTLAIDAGTTVEFTWLASSFHTVTSDGLFDTGVQQGGTFSFTFDTAGEYQVRCDLHAPMTMTITVTGSAPPPPPPSAVGVEVGDNFFSPESLAIDAGTTVEFTWSANSFHTVTSDGLFDTGVQQGGSFSFTFDAAGEYQVRCDLHAPMTMTVTVTGSAPPPDPGATSTPTPAPTATPEPTATAAPPPPGTVGVEVGDNFFGPDTLAIDAGTTVEFAWSSNSFHTVTSDGLFDTGVQQGGSFSFIFGTAGEYQVRCDLHAPMTMTVTVTGSAPPPAPVGVEVGDNFFAPDSLAIDAGTTVEWVWSANSFHTVTSNGLFDSGVQAGGTFSFKFDTAGEYQIQCVLHAPMTMTVTVTGSAPPPDPGATSTPTPAPTATPAPPPPPPPGSVGVEVGDNFFGPDALAIDAGTTVEWAWLTNSFHTVTSNGLFDTGIQQGGTFSFTFDTAGEYQIQCVLHPPDDHDGHGHGLRPTTATC